MPEKKYRPLADELRPTELDDVVGQNHILGKGGLLRNPEDAERVAADLRDWLETQPDWRVIGLIDSPVLGGDGNREFLLGGVKS